MKEQYMYYWDTQWWEVRWRVSHETVRAHTPGEEAHLSQRWMLRYWKSTVHQLLNLLVIWALLFCFAGPISLPWSVDTMVNVLDFTRIPQYTSGRHRWLFLLCKLCTRIMACWLTSSTQTLYVGMNFQSPCYKFSHCGQVQATEIQQSPIITS